MKDLTPSPRDPEPPEMRRWYDRKSAKKLRVIALKAVAHKLARACYFLLRDGGEFDVKRAFG
jgi:hypothetical protein